jgi:hypothetical protein
VIHTVAGLAAWRFRHALLPLFESVSFPITCSRTLRGFRLKLVGGFGEQVDFSLTFRSGCCIEIPAIEWTVQQGESDPLPEKSTPSTPIEI